MMTESKQQSSDACYAQAHELYEQGDLKGAWEMVNRVLEVTPYHHEAYWLLQDVERRTGPTGDPNRTILVTDTHGQLRWLIWEASHFENFIRKKVDGIQDIIWITMDTRTGVFDHYRLKGVALCVFSDDNGVAKRRIETALKEAKFIRRTHAEVQVWGGVEIPHHIAVVFTPLWEWEVIQRMERAKQEAQENQ
jgi:hypothetical protein